MLSNEGSLGSLLLSTLLDFTRGDSSTVLGSRSGGFIVLGCTLFELLVLLLNNPGQVFGDGLVLMLGGGDAGVG